jgi:hypothetical protein
MIDIREAQRGGVMKPFIFLQIMPPVRTARCMDVGGERDHTGMSTPERTRMSGLEIEPASGSDDW